MHENEISKVVLNASIEVHRTWGDLGFWSRSMRKPWRSNSKQQVCSLSGRKMWQFDTKIFCWLHRCGWICWSNKALSSSASQCRATTIFLPPAFDLPPPNESEIGFGHQLRRKENQRRLSSCRQRTVNLGSLRSLFHLTMAGARPELSIDNPVCIFCDFAPFATLRQFLCRDQ